MAPTFSCTSCSRSFALRGQLNRHQRTHVENEKRHTCLHCKYRTYQRTNLERHVLVKHTDCEPHICTLCGRPFKDKYVLNRYVKQDHGSATAQPLLSLASIPNDLSYSVLATPYEELVSPQLAQLFGQGGDTVQVPGSALPHSEVSAIGLSYATPSSCDNAQAASQAPAFAAPDLSYGHPTLTPLRATPAKVELCYGLQDGQHLLVDDGSVHIGQDLACIDSALYTMAMAQTPAVVDYNASPDGMTGAYLGSYSHRYTNYDAGGALDFQNTAQFIDGVAISQQPVHVADTARPFSVCGCWAETARPKRFYARPPSVAGLVRSSSEQAGSTGFSSMHRLHDF